MKQSKFKKAVMHCLRHNFPILVVGPPGIGKTQIIQQACEEMKIPCLVSHPVTSDPPDYKGLPFPDKDGLRATFLPYGDLDIILNTKEPMVYFLDDLGQAPASVQAACMQLLSARRINDKKISDKVTILAATNRREDRAGVQGILEPVKSRFVSIIELESDINDWVIWAIQNDMPERLISYASFRPDIISSFKPTTAMVNGCCPRTLESVGKLINSKVPDDLLFEMISGAAGSGFAVEYTAYCKIYKDLPTYEDILNSPQTVEVPKATDKIYAITGMVSLNCKPADLTILSGFIDRMPTEYQIKTWINISARGKKYTNTKAFSDWAIKNHNIMDWR
jgi:hypothetical protein